MNIKTDRQTDRQTGLSLRQKERNRRKRIVIPPSQFSPTPSKYQFECLNSKKLENWGEEQKVLKLVASKNSNGYHKFRVQRKRQDNPYSICKAKKRWKMKIKHKLWAAVLSQKIRLCSVAVSSRAIDKLATGTYTQGNLFTGAKGWNWTDERCSSFGHF